jgi:hypothetical protein
MIDKTVAEMLLEDKEKSLNGGFWHGLFLNCPMPEPENYDKSIKFISEIKEILGVSYKEPHYSGNWYLEEKKSYISFTWHSKDGEKTLALFVEEKEITYLKVWGIRMFSEMEDGILTEELIKPLFDWLNL